MPEARWDTEYRTDAAIMERIRFLERGTKRKRHEVTEQGNGDFFRFSHYDSAGMPSNKRLKTNRGIAIYQDLLEPYPLESLIGIDADWARDVWQEVKQHETLFQRILYRLPQQFTRHTYIKDDVDLLCKGWKRYHATMPIAPPVYVHQVDDVEDLVHQFVQRTIGRHDPNERHKRTPRSILKYLQTPSNDGSQNDWLNHNSFATIDVPGQNAKHGRTESNAVAPSPIDWQRQVKEVKNRSQPSSEDESEPHEKAVDYLSKPATGRVLKGRKERQL